MLSRLRWAKALCVVRSPAVSASRLSKSDATGELAACCLPVKFHLQQYIGFGRSRFDTRDDCSESFLEVNVWERLALKGLRELIVRSFPALDITHLRMERGALWAAGGGLQEDLLGVVREHLAVSAGGEEDGVPAAAGVRPELRHLIRTHDNRRFGVAHGGSHALTQSAAPPDGMVVLVRGGGDSRHEAGERGVGLGPGPTSPSGTPTATRPTPAAPGSPDHRDLHPALRHTRRPAPRRRRSPRSSTRSPATLSSTHLSAFALSHVQSLVPTTNVPYARAYPYVGRYFVIVKSAFASAYCERNRKLTYPNKRHQ